MNFTPHTWSELNGADSDIAVIGRVVATLVVFLLAVFFMGFIIWKKKTNKTKIWFTPYGLNKDNYLNPFEKMTFKYRLLKTDYKWWFFITLVFLLYWFGAYFVVSIIMMAEYNQFLTDYSTTGYTLVWDQKLPNSGGAMGRYAVVINGEEHPEILSFVLDQTYVSLCLSNLKDYLDQGPNGSNEISGFFPVEPNYVNGTDYQSYENMILNLWLRSWVYSNVFITPLCQSLAIIFPLTVIFSYKKDRASIIAPWAFLGGSVTIFGGVAGDDSVIVTWQFIIYDQQIFYLYHTYLMVVGFAWFTYTYRYSLKRWGLFMSFIIVYVFYVIITTRILNIQYFTTGMTSNDLTISGSYEIVTLVVGNSVPYPANLTLMLILFVGVTWLIICLKNYIHWKCYWKNVNKEECFKNDICKAVITLKNTYNKCLSKLSKF